jgi:cell division protein FtsI (penicillin-binding protein 3)
MVGLVVARLVAIQVVESDRYETFGEEQRLRHTVLPAGRGAILDRDGDALAVSTPQPTVYGDPALVTDPRATAEALAGIIDIDVDDVTQALSEPNRRFVYLARLVPQEQADAVTALDLEGIGIVEEPVRERPNGDLLARSLLGSVNDWHEPLGGLELFWNDVLSGQPGELRIERNDDGLPIPGGRTEVTPPVPGHDLALTIDRETQWLAEQLVAEQVEATGAAGGLAVVMQTSTGELLAAASVDAGADGGPAGPSQSNRVFHDSFEPGSVGKLFTIAAALEQGLVSPEEAISVPLYYRFSDKVFKEPYAPGDRVLSVTEILASSSNIGTIRIAERVGAESLHTFLDDLGIGTRTGADGGEGFPGEQAGRLRPLEEWRGTALATVAFGQGFTVTGVQLAAAYNTIANGGTYVPPTLVRGAVDPDGETTPLPRPEPRQVFSEATAEAMTRMLETVVTDGTGKRAAITGYRVAGKTGTAQKVDPTTGLYSSQAHVATFAGFVPSDDPQLTIVVVLDEPSTVHLAGAVAAPLFSELGRHALQTLHIPPVEEPVGAAG